jgi:uncharacterized membrane protein
MPISRMDQFRRSKSRRKIALRARQALGLAIFVFLVMAVTVAGNARTNPSLPRLLHFALVGAGEGIALLVVVFVLYRVFSQATRRR